MVYVSKLYNLPYTRAGFGEPVQNLFKFADGEKVISMLSLDPAELAAGQIPPTKDSSNSRPAAKRDSALRMKTKVA